MVTEQNMRNSRKQNAYQQKNAVIKERNKTKKSEFSSMEKWLIRGVSLVIMGGIVFCITMIILMCSIDY